LQKNTGNAFVWGKPDPEKGELDETKAGIFETAVRGGVNQFV
jgi:hypothetical protein